MSIPSDESVAWFFIGEGGATLGCSRRHERVGLSAILGYRITPHVAITNTDLDVMEVLERWFKVKKIKNNFCTRQPKAPRKTRFDIKVERFADVKKFLEIILPYLVGKKKIVCRLMLECLTKFGRGSWSDILKVKGRVTRKRGRILSINWNVDEERRKFLEMMKYREKILAINGGRTAKYRYPFFEKLWGMQNGQGNSTSN